MKVVIWLDDFRDPNSIRNLDRIDAYCDNGFDEILWAKNGQEFKSYFLEATNNTNKTLVGVFFDNDLGTPGIEGRHLFTWMDGIVRENNIPEFELNAQTANPAAKRELRLGFQSLKKFWKEQNNDSQSKQTF